MVERRNLVGGGLAAGLAALVAGNEAGAAALQPDGRDDRMVADAVKEVRDALTTLHLGPWRAIALVREQQRIWIRANHKYPDFIEIGIGVWDSLHDWHVRYQQPISMTRAADGRYVMVFMFTTFILRPDQAADYIGPPWDNERPRPTQ